MEQKIFKIKRNELQSLATKLTAIYGLPRINVNLSAYVKCNDRLFELSLENEKCSFRSYNKKNELDSRFLKVFKSTPSIDVGKKNIKFLIRVFDELGLNKALINKVIDLDYGSEDNKIKIRINSIVGDIFMTNIEDQEIEECKIEPLLKKISLEEIEKYIEKKKMHRDLLINRSGILNSEISEHASKFAIDMYSGLSSIAEVLSSKSNDYSLYEEYYKILVGTNLDSEENKLDDSTLFKPLSIIIPAYNSEKTILKLLKSIQSQKLTKEQKSELDIVVIDDGSDIRLIDELSPHLHEFDFKPKIIRNESNLGLSTARNIGVQLSRNDHLLFLDADILIPSNYLFEHSIRLQTIPNGLFMSLKENIEDTKFSIQDVQNGLPVPSRYDDKRVCRELVEDGGYLPLDTDKLMINRRAGYKYYEILDETNKFRNFGFGRVVNGNTLPAMVVGHNMSITKAMVLNIGGFSDIFMGWGLEDTYFGARAIYRGCFVIPVFTTGVYHINHPPRSGSEEKRRTEYVQNIEVYNNLIREKL